MSLCHPNRTNETRKIRNDKSTNRNHNGPGNTSRTIVNRLRQTNCVRIIAVDVPQWSLHSPEPEKV